MRPENPWKGGPAASPTASRRQRKSAACCLSLAMALSLAGLSGCSSARPSISAELAKAETLPVKKKLFILFSGERLSFGGWQVSKVKRDSSQHIVGPRRSRIEARLQEKYTFRVAQSGSGAWQSECLSDAKREDQLPFFGPIQEKGYRVALRCDFKAPGTGASSGTVWKLDLLEQDSDGRVLKGMLTDGRQAVQVTGTRNLGNSVREEGHTAFEFAADGKPLGAVLLANGDRVLFHPDASGQTRLALAAAAAALMLYSDSNWRMKDMVEARIQADRQMYL